MDLHNCITAVKKESLFYENWTVEIPLLRAQSELDIVMGPLVDKVFCDYVFATFWV